MLATPPRELHRDLRGADAHRPRGVGAPAGACCYPPACRRRSSSSPARRARTSGARPRGASALRPGVRAFGVGGPRLRAAGLEALAPAEDISVMGFAEVCRGCRGSSASCAPSRAPPPSAAPEGGAARRSPRLQPPARGEAQAARDPVVYYVSPTIWAWRQGRAEDREGGGPDALHPPVRASVLRGDRRRRARFVGHPFAERPAAGRARSLPRGARPRGRPDHRRPRPWQPPLRAERLFPPMLEAAERIRAVHPDAQFVVPVASTLPREALEPYLAQHRST